MEEPNTRRIVLLGKTGSGKSSLANTLFGGEPVFMVNNSPNSGTKLCESDIKNVNGTNIQLIDTPGLFDTDPRSTELNLEILKCIEECAPGPHAFLLVLKVEKFTMLEQAVVALMLKYFSEEALKYTTVVFTHGDNLPEEMKIEEWVKQNESLRNLVQKCGGRCHVFDNRYWKNFQDGYRNNQYQVKELLKTIDETVIQNGRKYYTNELLQMVEEQTEKEALRIKKFSPNTSLKDILKKAKEFVFNTLKNNIGGSIKGALLGALLGAVGLVALVAIGAPCAIHCVAAAGGVAVGVAVGSVIGAWVSEKYGSPTEAVQDAKSFLRELEELFEQLNKTKKAAQAICGSAF